MIGKVTTKSEIEMKIASRHVQEERSMGRVLKAVIKDHIPASTPPGLASRYGLPVREIPFTMSDWPFSCMLIGLDLLNLDDGYQRKAQIRHIHTIYTDFTPARVGALCVNRRTGANGRDEYYIIDGQHRYIVLNALGIKSVWCHVYQVPQKEEALLIRLLNTGAAAFKVQDRYRAGLYHGDEAILSVDAIVAECGFATGVWDRDDDPPSNFIHALEALLRIHGGDTVGNHKNKIQRTSPDRLRRVLNLVANVWGTEDPGARTYYMLLGLKTLLDRFDKQIDDAVLANHLRDVDASQIHSMMVATQDFYRNRPGRSITVGRTNAVALIIAQQYPHSLDVNRIQPGLEEGTF